MAVNIKKIGSEELEKQKKYCQKVSSLLEKRYKIRTSRLPVS